MDRGTTVSGHKRQEEGANLRQCDPVFRHVHIDNRTGLYKQLPQDRLVHLFVQSAHVNSGILVPFRNRSGSHVVSQSGISSSSWLTVVDESGGGAEGAERAGRGRVTR